MRAVMLGILFAAVSGGWLTTAQAQMFGERNLGQPITRQPSPGQTPTTQPLQPGNPSTNLTGSLAAGLDSGVARFLRDSRSEGAFVGRDTRDVAGFVGTVQTDNLGAVTSAVDGLNILQGPNVNRIRPEPILRRPGPYRPRLTVGFEFTGRTAPVLERHLTTRLATGLEARLASPVKVEVVGRKAILSGEVASEYARTLAGELVRLEPGVSQVENRLRVAERSDSLAEPRP